MSGPHGHREIQLFQNLISNIRDGGTKSGKILANRKKNH